MKNIFEQFYRGCYQQTHGFIPVQPLNHNIYPGDFFQIRDGKMIILGNIYQQSVVASEETSFDYGIKLDPGNWHFSAGMSKSYSGRGVGNNPMEFDHRRQILSFDIPGGYFFLGNNPESVRIRNWNEIENELIIKLTQTLFSFREVYVATECASTSDWTLAVSSSGDAELELASDSGTREHSDVFGDAEAKTVQSVDIEYYHRQPTRKPVFFKAKKLALRDEKINDFILELMDRQTIKSQWADDFFDYDFQNDQVSHPSLIASNLQSSVLDMMQANQLNPNTALSYFRWENANLDDVEKLFPCISEI